MKGDEYCLTTAHVERFMGAETQEQAYLALMETTEEILGKYLNCKQDIEWLCQKLVPEVLDLLMTSGSEEDRAMALSRLASQQACRHISNHIDCWAGCLFGQTTSRPDVISQVIDSLGDPRGRLIRHVMVDGMSLQQAADTLHLDVQSARRAYLRAQYEIRKELIQRGVLGIAPVASENDSPPAK